MGQCFVLYIATKRLVREAVKRNQEIRKKPAAEKTVGESAIKWQSMVERYSHNETHAVWIKIPKLEADARN